MRFLCSNNYVIDLDDLQCITLTTGPTSTLPGAEPSHNSTLTIYLKGKESPVQIIWPNIEAARSEYAAIVSLIPNDLIAGM